MGYAIPSISKLKGGAAMTAAYHHNFRVVHPLNADRTKSHQNREIVDELHGRTYEDMFQDTMRNLYIEGAYRRTPRKDAVHGIEVLMTMSREDIGKVDLDQWVQANVTWLKKRFNPPRGEIQYKDPETDELKTSKVENVVSVVLHMDESVPHLHAVVIPIDERGHLNADHYFGGKENLRSLHDEYAKAMEPFGLERGERYTTAHQEKMRAFYAKLEKAVDAVLPPPEPGEKVEDYHRRAQEVYRTAAVHHRDEQLKTIQQSKREHAAVIEERIMIQDTIKKMDKLSELLGVEEMDDAAFSRLKTIVQDRTRFEYATERNPDREKAQEALKRYEEMLRWAKRHRILEKDEKHTRAHQ